MLLIRECDCPTPAKIAVDKRPKFCYNMGQVIQALNEVFISMNTPKVNPTTIIISLVLVELLGIKELMVVGRNSG